jgi:hypothetical protein
MAEAKLWDPSNDSELDAVAKVVKEKNLFTRCTLNLLLSEFPKSIYIY